MDTDTQHSDGDGPRYLPRIPYSRKTLTALIAKDYADLSDDEYKFLFLRFGYLSDQERAKYPRDAFTDEGAFDRLGTDFFEMMDELRTHRAARAEAEPGRGWEHYLMTASEIQAYVEEQEAKLRSAREAKRIQYKAQKERWQRDKATRKRARKSQRTARKKARN